MTYIIRNADKSIKTFFDRGDDLVLNPGETLEYSNLSFVQYANQLRLSLNGKSGETITVPVGSGDQVVTVSCSGETAIDININGIVTHVPLQYGVGQLTLGTENAGIFILIPADRQKFAAAGESVLVIEVKE